MRYTRELTDEELANIPDSEIDYSDIPDMGNELMAYVKLLRKQQKQMVSLRLDKDIVKWFKQKAKGRGYQTDINNVLRSFMVSQSN